MREKVAGHSRARGFGVEPPERGAALGDVFRDRPILQVGRPVVEGPPDAAFIDDLFSPRRWTAHGGS